MAVAVSRRLPAPAGAISQPYGGARILGEPSIGAVPSYAPLRMSGNTRLLIAVVVAGALLWFAIGDIAWGLPAGVVNTGGSIILACDNNDVNIVALPPSYDRTAEGQYIAGTFYCDQEFGEGDVPLYFDETGLWTLMELPTWLDATSHCDGFSEPDTWACRMPYSVSTALLYISNDLPSTFSGGSVLFSYGNAEAMMADLGYKIGTMIGTVLFIVVAAFAGFLILRRMIRRIRGVMERENGNIR